MRFVILAWLVAVVGPARAGAIRCDDVSTADLAVDGLLDDWKQDPVLARIGGVPDAAIELRCSWDGTALAMALDIKDDRVVRVRGKGHEDHVDITIGAGGKPVVISAYPGNAIARSKLAAPPKIELADSLQPKGFSLELRVPAARIPGFSASTPSFDVNIVFHDSDQAAGGADHDVQLATTIELGDRKDLLEDFLRQVRLKRADVKLDVMAELDPDRRGKERLVAGGTVIGVITDQFAFVQLPVSKPADVRELKLVPFGKNGLQIVTAVVRQSGNGGSRDLLVLWTVWSGQLQPLAQIEVRKELRGNILESSWTLGTGKKGPELVVEPKPAVGWTQATWNEQTADDADSILLPWDAVKGGTAYTLHGHELERRDLPVKKKKR